MARAGDKQKPPRMWMVRVVSGRRNVQFGPDTTSDCRAGVRAALDVI